MLRAVLAALVAFLLAGSAFAQNQNNPPPMTLWCQSPGSAAVQCGTATTPLVTSGGGTFSVAGFTPSGNYATLTATNSSASVALPNGGTVQFANTGTTAVSCTLGIGSATATASELVIQAGSNKSIVVGSNTFGACIDQTGSASNVVVLAGGSGLGNDSGSGGSVTQGTSPWVDNVTQWASQALGAMANYGTSPGAVLVPGVNAFVTNAVALAAGSAIIGKMGIDQTTDVTTNGVEIAPTTGSAAGIAPGVAGSASSSVVLKASAGNLYSVYATSGSTQGWLMVFNATSLPGNGGTTAGTASGNLQDCIYAPANSTTGINYNPGPVETFSVGITAAFSSTACSTLTASATAYLHGSAK
jgi:hypothetical protein